MKKVKFGVLFLIMFLICFSAFSIQPLAEHENDGNNLSESAYRIIVNEKEIETDDLPYQPYNRGDTVMVPLRKIAEALGYTVNWNAQTGAVTIDDDYIQKATLYGDSAEVEFKGHLKIIDMSRQVEMEQQAIIYDGYTYVPLSFFREFFNDAEVNDMVITVAPSKNELA